jgi:hypothetical protein
VARRRPSPGRNTASPRHDEDTLDGAKSKRYRHAARHLAECQALASAISDYGEFEPHETFVSRLRARHGRKSGFWTLIAGPTPVTASHSR